MNTDSETRSRLEMPPSGESPAVHVPTANALRKRLRKKRAKKAQTAVSPLLSFFPHLKDAPLPTAEKASGLTDAKFLQGIWASCGFDHATPVRSNPAAVSQRAKIKERLANHYLASLERLSAERQAYTSFFDECLKANIRLRVSPEVDLKRYFLAAAFFANEHEKLFKRLRSERSISLPSPLNRFEIEQLSGDLTNGWDRLRGLLWQSVSQFVDSLREELKRLADHFALGAVRWIADEPPGCRATYFSQVLLLRSGEKRLRDGMDSIACVRCEAVHTVSLLNAYSRPASDRQRLFAPKRPERVERVIELIPPSLRDRLSVVYGTRAKAFNVEREVEILDTIPSPILPPRTFDSVRLRRDPLLVWGDLVLCGWDDDEWTKEKSDKQFTTFPYLIR